MRAKVYKVNLKLPEQLHHKPNLDVDQLGCFFDKHTYIFMLLNTLILTTTKKAANLI